MKDPQTMNRKQRTVLGAAAASLLAFSVLAEDASMTQPENQQAASQDGAAVQAGRLGDAARASDIIGMNVHNLQDERLGEVKDLAVDVESGRIVQVILSIGGFLGMGDTLTAVPPGALQRDAANNVLQLDADQEKLKAAPAYDLSKWTEFNDTTHLAEVYRHYGEEAAFTFIHDGDASAVEHAQQATASIPAARLSRVQMASALMGTEVRNRQEEELGDIENIIVDLPSGRIVAMIVSSGGFLGVGDALSAIPPAALQFDAERDALVIDASREQLSRAPHFKADQWPDFSQPGNAVGVYSAYNVEPYFTTNAVSAADNTTRNVRDRDDRTLTPLDQGASTSDVAITAQIRKEIIAGDNMSVNAQNVKIITNGGQVTLRGPVNSDEEKRLIGEIAQRASGSGSVNNQLEVVRATTSRID